MSIQKFDGPSQDKNNSFAADPHLDKRIADVELKIDETNQMV